MNFIEIIKPDDWHVHFREGKLLKPLVQETSKIFNRSIVMPNLIHPIQTEKSALSYREKILEHVKNNPNFEPLITLYLSDDIDVKEIEKAYKNRNVFAAKLYPAGATTNASKGVKSFEKIYHIFEKMSELQMPLLIHGEVNDKSVDVFYREQIFIEDILEQIITNFPELKITLEHITTDFAVNYIKSQRSNVCASITPHHLILNRSDMLEHKIKPHYYCLPILKKEDDRKSLLDAATSGNNKFFLGTDSAPHTLDQKENECGCAGIFNTINSLQIVTQIFDDAKKLENLEKFVSINGPNHYNLKINTHKVKLHKKIKPIDFNDYLVIENVKVKIFKPPFDVFWDYT